MLLGHVNLKEHCPDSETWKGFEGRQPEGTYKLWALNTCAEHWAEICYPSCPSLITAIFRTQGPEESSLATAAPATHCSLEQWLWQHFKSVPQCSLCTRARKNVQNQSKSYSQRPPGKLSQIDSVASWPKWKPLAKDCWLGQRIKTHTGDRKNAQEHRRDEPTKRSGPQRHHMQRENQFGANQFGANQKEPTTSQS